MRMLPPGLTSRNYVKNIMRKSYRSSWTKSAMTDGKLSILDWILGRVPKKEQEKISTTQAIEGRALSTDLVTLTRQARPNPTLEGRIPWTILGVEDVPTKDGETIEDFMKRFKVETGRMKGAPECMRISRFMHGMNNLELIKRLNEHVPKTMEEMMITTTAFIQGEAAALLVKRKVTHPGRHRTNPKGKTQIKGKHSHLIKEIKHGRDQSKTRKKEKTAKDKPTTIYMIQSWQRKTIQKVTQSFEQVKEITFLPLAASSRTKGPLVIEAEMGRHMIHCMYVDGGSSMKILYEHCFNWLQPEIKSQMVPATTSLTGFCGETIWPLGQLRLLVIIGDANYSTSAWMNFMIVRSLSPYNGIIGRPGIRAIQAVPSTVHGMLKFPIEGGIVTIRSTVLIPNVCTLVIKSSTVSKEERTRPDNFKVALHPDFPGQEDCYPLPEIDWKVESLCGYPFKCFLDAYKGYHHIQLAEPDEEKTAFHTGQKVYCYTKMPFGLKNAGATYQQLMDKAFESQIGQNIEVQETSAILPSTSYYGHYRLTIKQIMSRPDVAGRLQKWSIMLGEHNITYRPRTLRIAAWMGVKNVHVSFDSKLVANQILGTYVAKEDNMVKYLDVVKSVAVILYVVVKMCWTTPGGIHLPITRIPHQPLTPITDLWPFYKSGIDIAGPFLKGRGKVKFLIVVMDYFMKWIEEKAVVIIMGGQVKELPHVLWAHRTMIKSSHGNTPSSLTYGTKAVIQIEIGMPTYRTTAVDMVSKDEELRINLDLLEERHERAAICEANAKSKMMKYYNARVRDITFRPGDFVYCSNDASHAVAGGKLGPKWEGPYEVTKALGDEAYKLRFMDETILPRTWNIANLKQCYL
uniref:Reverse transcriptase domain-containing protein n=1 Tax=Tanacetum cinerariifolium TaxID=118510 RepID=A0A6L2J4E2_TANCI|nr:reverse transcriptase domain-containing protein [Tanacetum cinerariifolium]